MLSLPEDWDYTTKGLSMICKDGVDSIELAAIKRFETSRSRRYGVPARPRLCGERTGDGVTEPCRFLAYGFRPLAIQGIFQYDDREYLVSEVPRNACQAEYNLYLQCAGR